MRNLDHQSLLQKAQFWKKSKIAEAYSSIPSNAALEDILYNDESFKKEIHPEVQSYLENLGYTLIERLDGGENNSESDGHTSIVYLANFHSGDINKKRVVKIPVNWIDSSSITTIINMSKKNVYSNEIKYAQHFSNELAHDNIIDVVDHLRVKGQDIIVENYVARSKSLKSLLRWSVPDDNNLKTIYNKILNGFEHMHNNGVIYRDGKSSNILVTNDGLVKIIDLQNCIHENDHLDSALQTKGGTDYSKPDVINAVMTGKSVHPSKSMDRHSLGVIAYEMVTGKLPFNYKLKRAKEGHGKEICVSGKKYNILLLRNDKPVDEITEEMYNEDVKNALKSLKGKEKRFVRFFEKAFTSDSYKFNSKDKKTYNSIDAMRQDFNDILNSRFRKLTDIIYSSIKPALITTAVVATLGGVILIGRCTDRNAPKRPTLAEMITKSNYDKFGLEDLKDPEYSYMWSELKPRINKLQKKHEALVKSGNEYYNTDIPLFIEMAYRSSDMNKRIYSSLLKAIATTDTNTFNSFYNRSYMDDRRWPTLVPQDFRILSQDYTQKPIYGPVAREDRFKSDGVYLRENMALASMFLKANMGYGKDIADVFASYFCSSTELANAKINSKSRKYFAYEDDHEIMPGYGTYIDELESSLVEKAVILYELTDDEGNIDWNKVPQFASRGIGGNNYRFNDYQAYPVVKDTIVKK